MSLKSKIISIFDVYVPEGQSEDQTIKEINRRGKIDIVKVVKILFMLAEEVDRLNGSKPTK